MFTFKLMRNNMHYMKYKCIHWGSNSVLNILHSTTPGSSTP